MQDQGDDYRRRVGRRIRQARQRQGWTQTELARRMGVAEGQVNKWENGRVMPNPRNLERLGRTLGVPAETFLLPDDG